MNEYLNLLRAKARVICGQYASSFLRQLINAALSCDPWLNVDGGPSSSGPKDVVDPSKMPINIMDTRPITDFTISSLEDLEYGPDPLPKHAKTTSHNYWTVAPPSINPTVAPIDLTLLATLCGGDEDLYGLLMSSTTTMVPPTVPQQAPTPSSPSSSSPLSLSSDWCNDTV